MVIRRISNDELYHHGVKGQKWGVRKQPQLIGRQHKRINPLSNTPQQQKQKQKRKILQNYSAEDKRTLKMVTAAAAAEAAIIGSAFAYDYIKKKRKKKINSSEIKNSINTGKAFFESFNPESFKYDAFSFNTFKYK